MKLTRTLERQVTTSERKNPQLQCKLGKLVKSFYDTLLRVIKNENVG